MKVKVHLRVAKGPRGPKVEASAKPNYSPIYQDKRGYGNREALPTVAFAVTLDIPDSAFKKAEEVVAEINLPEGQLEIAGTVQ